MGAVDRRTFIAALAFIPAAARPLSAAAPSSKMPLIANDYKNGIRQYWILNGAPHTHSHSVHTDNPHIHSVLGQTTVLGFE